MYTLFYSFIFLGENVNKVPVIHHQEYPSKFYPELCILFQRMLLIVFRDHVSIRCLLDKCVFIEFIFQFLVKVRLFVHFLLGIMFGVLYIGLGDSALHVRDNAVLLFFCVMFMSYVAAFTMSIKCWYFY